MPQQYLQKYLQKIAVNLSKLLKIHSMNILELSTKTKISYSSLHNLINQKQNPTLETLLVICNTLNIRLSELVGDIELLASHNPTVGKEVPIIPWDQIMDYLNNNQNHNVYENGKVITSGKNISSTSFALKTKNFKCFLENSMLIFEKIISETEKYIDCIVLVASNKRSLTLKKLLMDNNSFFLESIEHNFPIRALTEDDQIIAWLVQSITDF